MYLIAMYIIGFVLCIIGNLIDRHSGETNGMVLLLVALWMVSPIAVPLVFFIGFLCGVGALMKYLTKRLEKSISQIRRS